MINKLAGASIRSKDDLILEYCKNRNVLDVGCVGQDKNINNSEWIHEKIKSVANALTGTDIHVNEIDRLNKLGYSIKTPDSLNKEIKYEIITIFDVIEHVDNVVEFVKFHAKLLDDDGLMIITTPNPFNIRQILNIFLFKIPSVNEEHTVWIDPLNFLEVSKRCNMKVVEFYWINEYFKHTKFYWRILDYILIKPLRFFRRYLSANYAIIIKNEKT